MSNRNDVTNLKFSSQTFSKVGIGLQFKLTVSIILAFLLLSSMQTWFLGFGQHLFTNQTYLQITAIAGTVFLAAVIAFFVIRLFIKKTLDKLTDFGKRLGRNDLSGEIDMKTKDEFGQIAEIFNHTAQNMRVLIAQIQKAVENVSANSQQLAANTKQIDRASEEVAATIQEIANGANEQSQQVTESAQAVDEVVNSIRRIDEKIKILDKNSDKVLDDAHKGKGAITESLEAMTAIEQYTQKVETAVNNLQNHSEEIGNIIGIINSIAEQTNLLALNAAIEAARAGEAGRGFSVVAEEIRKLAEQSQKSTSDITELIYKTQTNTSEVVKLMAGAGAEVHKGVETSQKTRDTFDNIAKGNEESIRQVKEISGLISEISSASEQAGAALQEISSITEESSAGIEETASSVEEQAKGIRDIMDATEGLSQLNKELSQLISQFKLTN